MQKVANVTFWTLLLCLGGFLVAWNLRLMWSDSFIPLVVSPENVEFQEAFTEGSTFQAEFVLENRNRSSLFIKKIISSCGCTGLFTKEGERIEMPMVLARSELFPILVSIDTKNMDGKRNVSVMVFYEYREKSLFSVGNVIFEVTPKNDEDASE